MSVRTKRSASDFASESLENALEELDIEVESRCSELHRLSASLCASLSDSFRVQIANLPKHVRYFM